MRLFWGTHSCESDGHVYFARHDDVIDPRLEAKDIMKLMSSAFQRDDMHKTKAKLYIRDICRYCGDVIERTEGLNALEVLAHQAKRIA